LLVKDINVKLEMTEKYPEDVEKNLMELNLKIKHSHDDLRTFG